MALDGREALAAKTSSIDFDNETNNLTAVNKLGMHKILDKFPDALEVDPPEANPDCQYKGCYGRGRIGFNVSTGEDIDCPKCMFPREFSVNFDVEREDAMDGQEAA